MHHFKGIAPPERISHRRLARRATGLTVLALGAVLSCVPRMFASDPSTTGDEPSKNLSTTAPVKNVPYCSGGDRASQCVFGANCRVTEQGCQVCQCLSP
jgi:hypothetical protein